MSKFKKFLELMKQKVQRFGAAMFAPVLMFTFASIVLGISIVFTNPNIMGSLASENTIWFIIWTMIKNAGWTVFNHMPLLFAITLPIGLAKKQNARACMESFVLYLTFHYFMNTIMTFFGSSFGVDFFSEKVVGVTQVAGIKTLDMGLFGAFLISGMVVWLHNRFFDTKIPEWLGIFKGSVFIYMIGFFTLIPVAFICALVWPSIQQAIASMQHFFIDSGEIGVGVYGFLERLLIPTGLSRFIETPFVYENAVVNGGTTAYWLSNVGNFAKSTLPLKTLFPAGGFALFGNAKIFGSIGIASAFYATAKPEKKKYVASLLISATLTAVLCGITEPLEFTFLFVAPVLFFVHSVLAGLVQAVMYAFGIVGMMGEGLIMVTVVNWIPLFKSHGFTYVKQIIIGLIFTAIYFFVFKFLIIKFNFKTPGRENESEEAKLYTKKDYIKQKNLDKEVTDKSEEKQKAEAFIKNLGGAANIIEVTNCATRLRLTVADHSLLQNEAAFKKSGAHGLVVKGNSVQVIVGLSVPTVREYFENIMEKQLKLSEE